MLGSKVNFKSNDGMTDYIINDRANIDSGWKLSSPKYYAQLIAVDGLYGSDISYESDPLPNEPGEISGDVIRRGKGLTLSGKIWANSLGDLESGAQILQHMFWETLPRQLLWWPLNSNHTDNNARVYVTARVNNDLVVTQSLDNISDVNQLYNWPWTVGLRCDNPRIYKSSDNTVYQSWQT